MKIMIDRAIKFRCRAADRGTLSGLAVGRRPSAVGRRRSRRGLVQPCSTPRGAIRPQLLVMSRFEAFRGASYAPFLPSKSQPHGDTDDADDGGGGGGGGGDGGDGRAIVTEIDRDEFRRAQAARAIDSEQLQIVSWNPSRFKRKLPLLCKSRNIFAARTIVSLRQSQRSVTSTRRSLRGMSLSCFPRPRVRFGITRITRTRHPCVIAIPGRLGSRGMAGNGGEWRRTVEGEACRDEAPRSLLSRALRFTPTSASSQTPRMYMHARMYIYR